MDIHIAYKPEDLLREGGWEDVSKVQFDQGYAALAKDPQKANMSAELWAERSQVLDEKIPEGAIPGVAAELHAFLDILEVKSKTYGHQPKLNFIYERKSVLG
ncbi:hypothetical protein VTN77DRAFT_6227 [Rasamsonia byssochlamydoides]|uniref:uncharacterized protein n=1 Tax=Rasamsonia byssochlamydoides TaxID=89139 RepID=UPI003743FC42